MKLRSAQNQSQPLISTKIAPLTQSITNPVNNSQPYYNNTNNSNNNFNANPNINININDTINNNNGYLNANNKISMKNINTLNNNLPNNSNINNNSNNINNVNKNVEMYTINLNPPMSNIMVSASPRPNINQTKMPPPVSQRSKQYKNNQYNNNIYNNNQYNNTTQQYSNTNQYNINKQYPYNQTTPLLSTSPYTPINYTQINPNSTSQILLTQLQNKNKQLYTQNRQIQQLQQTKQSYNKQIYNLNNVIHSFYTKGAPLQSELAKQVFDGSYPTLIQQADAMRKELADKNKQLIILTDEKSRQSKQLKQYKWRINHYHNRITDLQFKLQQQYNRVDHMKQQINNYTSMPIRLQRENVQLRNAIMENESRNKIIMQENSKLKSMVQTVNARNTIKNNDNNIDIAKQQQQQQRRKQNEIQKLQQKLYKIRQQSSQLQSQHSQLYNKTKSQGAPSITVLDQQQRNPQQMSNYTAANSKMRSNTINTKIQANKSMDNNNTTHFINNNSNYNNTNYNTYNNSIKMKKDAHSTIDKSSSNEKELLDLSMRIQQIRKQNDSLRSILYHRNE